MTERVKGYIDAGICVRPKGNANCGTGSTSYYKTFIYKGKRVIITSQIPDHPAENDQLDPNPNVRCEIWQFASLPIDPAKGSTAIDTNMGTTGLAVTGASFFNDLKGGIDLAFFYEAETQDSCFGHSTKYKEYHYHANINCTNAGSATGANDPNTCLHIGYLLDGVPLYGFCKDSSGVQMTSCYKLTSTASTGEVFHVGGTYTGIGKTRDDYEYDDAAYAAGSCQLDEANGAIHPTTGKYSYFATYDYPYVPRYYYGQQGKTSVCSAN